MLINELTFRYHLFSHQVTRKAEKAHHIFVPTRIIFKILRTESVLF